MTYYQCACDAVINSTDRHDDCPNDVIRVDLDIEGEFELHPTPGSLRFFATGCPPSYVIMTPWEIVDGVENVLIHVGVGTVQLSPDDARKMAKELVRVADACVTSKADA